MRDSASVKELMNELFDPKASHKAGLSENAVTEALGLLKKAGTAPNTQDSLDKLFGSVSGELKNPFKVDKDLDSDFYKCASIIKGGKIADEGINRCAFIIKGEKIADEGINRCASIIKGDKIANIGGDNGVFHCAYFIKPGDKEGNEVFKCAHKVQLGKDDRADVFKCAYKIDKKDLAALTDKDLNSFKAFEK